LVAKVKSPKGRIVLWLKEGNEIESIVERIYLATLSRRPTGNEMVVVLKHLKTLSDPKQGLQDLQFALVNLNEFLLRH
jgi:hypothetical protein